MVTVHRAYGFRFVMYTNDHSPAHVHVCGQGGEAKITFSGSKGLTLDWAIGISRADIIRIMEEAQYERVRLIEAWRSLHDR
jgi:hypothetical protein